MSTLRPTVLNASINRQGALACLAAGMSPEDIAIIWPEVFFTDGDGKLGQTYHDEAMYDYVDGDGTRVPETSYTIAFVSEAIATFNAGASAKSIFALYEDY